MSGRPLIARDGGCSTAAETSRCHGPRALGALSQATACRESAQDVAAAGSLLRARLPDHAEPEPDIRIKRGDLRLTCSFVYEVLPTFKAVRHFLRANPALLHR